MVMSSARRPSTRPRSSTTIRSRDLKARAQAAIKLASEIGGAIDELRTSPQDRGQDRQDRAKLRHWSAEARKLGNSI